ncbi:uncharacterized protein [Chelonus insularis]|uniref:uncharacterized protein n=1 Tax=Chelonus insularis TaxID=460826 RepID=UPI00158AB6A7|nr:uncharacterized protein LOC118070505 [Chelonus insularis]
MKTLMSQHQEKNFNRQDSGLATRAMNNQFSSATHDPRLPRINLPRYDGTHQDWLSFKDLFSSIVVANNSISDTEKLQYLKSCLRGPAAQLLDSTTISADNFIQAWESLKSFYDSRRILVNSTLDGFFAIKEVKQESGMELERLYTSITQSYRTLKTLKRPVEYWDDILVHIVVRQKLDSRSIRAWEQHIGSSDEPPTWDKLQTFIISRARTLRAIENSQGKRTSKTLRPPLKSHFTSHNNKEEWKKESCQLCSEKHKLTRCPAYHRKTVQQRNQVVKDFKLCFNCLGPHQMFKCQSTARCQTCGRKHHTSLHEKRPSPTNNATPSASSPKQVHHVRSAPATIILPTAIIKVSNSVGEFIPIRALLDQGSEISLISEKIAQKLRLTRKQSSLPIIGIGAYQSGNTRGITSVKIQPRFKSTFKLTVDAHILPRLTSTIPAEKTYPASWNHIKKLRLADPDYTEPGNIEMIIGADVYGTLLEKKRNSGTKREIGDSKKTLSPDEKACEEIFKSTHSRNPQTGQYIVRLPFKSDLRLLGDSRPTAMRLLHSLQTKFANDAEYHQLYSSFLKEYEQLGHMIKLPSDTPPKQPSFLLPHHGVKRESSTTTKLRVVFNGSCKTINGQPINELLHSGPKLQLDLFNILIWIRQHRYMFSTDIEKMYRQIQVHPEDWKLQQILWKDDDKVITFQLTTVTYGLACAPYLALRSVLQLIEDEGKNFPLAIDTMLKGRYVDDIFGGADSIKEAEQKAKQVNNLCMAGGLPLRKWISNNAEILKEVPDEYKVSTDEIHIKNQSVPCSWTTMESIRGLPPFQIATAAAKVYKTSSPLQNSSAV